jgi:23S rRNA (cytosine1962-C5)-methyltransferase
MKNAKGIVLKPGKDKAVRNRHHWIFSGAVASLPAELADGGISPVLSDGGELLGYAYVNRNCSILGRMVSFGPGDPFAALEKNILKAIALRRDLFGDGEATNAYRLINAEGDGIPGLVVDRYESVLVLQVATLGMEKLKDFVLETLVRELVPETVYEKSNIPSRREEGLGDREGFLHGEERDMVLVREDGLEFLVDVVRSQKTGLYLDQREMRKLVGTLARGRSVLNCFAYSGGFSVHALRGGAVRVDSVDSSASALEAAKRNFFQNSLPVEGNGFIEADVFEFLRGPAGGYDLVILDPPAFAKRKSDVRQACRGYKDINRLAIQKAPPGTLLLTFSCSHFVDEGLFRQVVFQAAAEASRGVRILGRHIQAPDHPVNIFHPETEYLKGLLLYID